jgi:hypothetical protein
MILTRNLNPLPELAILSAYYPNMSMTRVQKSLMMEAEIQKMLYWGTILRGAKNLILAKRR